VLFFIGGVPAILTVFVRFGVKESAVWEKTREVHWTGLWRAIGRNWKIFLLMTLLMTMMNLSSHGTQDNYRTFLASDWNFTPQRISNFIAISMVGAILGGVAFGLFSDRFGRRRSMCLAFAGALLCIPLWAYAPTAVGLVTGAFLLQFMVQGAWGVIPAHISELAPDAVRGLLPGFAYQCGNLLASPINPLQTKLAEHLHTSYANVMAASAVIIFGAALIVIATGREKRGWTFGEDG
jgi:MFS transporter, SHS family, lactate transporter